MKEVKLTTGEVSYVDDLDHYLAVTNGPWSCSSGKAVRFLCRDVYGKGILLYLHHLILPSKDGYEVDHINRNGLDNTRNNLRYLTHSKNIHNRTKQKNNTSNFIGVKFSASANGWQSRTMIKGKRYHHGTFKTAIEAAIARDDFVKYHLPGIAILNFP